MRLSFLKLSFTCLEDIPETYDVFLRLRVSNCSKQSIDDIKTSLQSFQLIFLIFYEPVDATFEEKDLH
jgi:hypothetical protein